MSKMCYFDGVLCTVEETKTGWVLTKVSSVETFESTENKPVKPVKAVKADNKISLGNLGNESKATPINNEKSQTVKPVKPAKKAKIDIVQTQKTSNQVQNGSYKVEIIDNLLEITCPDGTKKFHKQKTEIKTDNFAKTGYLKVLEKIIGKLSDNQESDCFGYSKYTDVSKKYMITVRNSAK